MSVSQMRAARLEFELEATKLRLDFEQAMISAVDGAKNEAAQQMRSVVSKLRKSHRKVRRRATETEKRLQQELGMTQKELWRQTSTIEDMLEESAHQVIANWYT